MYGTGIAWVVGVSLALCVIASDVEASPFFPDRQDYGEGVGVHLSTLGHFGQSSVGTTGDGTTFSAAPAWNGGMRASLLPGAGLSILVDLRLHQLRFGDGPSALVAEQTPCDPENEVCPEDPANVLTALNYLELAAGIRYETRRLPFYLGTQLGIAPLLGARSRDESDPMAETVDSTYRVYYGVQSFWRASAGVRLLSWLRLEAEYAVSMMTVGATNRARRSDSVDGLGRAHTLLFGVELQLWRKDAQ